MASFSFDLSVLLIPLSRSEPTWFSIQPFGAHTLGLVSSFDSIPAGSCQGCAGQDEDGGGRGKVWSANFFFAVWDVPAWVSPDGLTSRLFCLPLSSWSPWKGNEPAERGEWGSRVPAEKAVKSSLSSELRMLPCFILLFEHGPCKMHEAKFCQSVLNQSLLNEAVSCHNLSQIKNLKSKKVQGNYKISSIAENECGVLGT